MSTPAPLLSPAVIEQAKRLGAAIRQRRVAALVGSGISCQVGLPRWNELVRRLILAWKLWDDSVQAKQLSAENYVRLYHDTFDNDLAIVSYLQRVAAEEGGPQFGDLLYGALYPIADKRLAPEPSHIHRHLIALFQDHPKRIWTTNYDDLLEEAASLNDVPVSSLDPDSRLTDGNFLVSHLHGYMPPDRGSHHTNPTDKSVILAEDDYHALTMAIVGWTHREYYRVFDDHQVFILGMSLDDPNLRRVLATIPFRGSKDPTHFALLRALSPDDLNMARLGPRHMRECAADANKMRSLYWEAHGVEIIVLNTHEDILPFLLRVRHESYGDQPGDLWTQGSRIGYDTISPWRDDRQAIGRLFLREMAERLTVDFSLAPDELVEVGILLLKADTATLELVFRSGPWTCEPGWREFDVHPDHPTGVAGRVFVSGDMVRVQRDDPLHDYGLLNPKRETSSRYAGIVSVPLIDWAGGGIPIGVAYVTTSTNNGALFQLSNERKDPTEKTLNDLYAWISRVSMTFLNSWAN